METSLLCIMFFKDTYFTNTKKAITWCKRLLGFSGVWPLEIRDSLFVPFLFYGCLYSFLGFLDLIEYIKDIRYVMTNVMENMLVVMTVTKFGICRIKYRSLSRFLTETENDYIVDNYKTEEERLIFMKYNKFSYIFIMTAFPSMTFLTIYYYFKNVIPNVLAVMANSSLEYKLPYKIKPLLKPYDAKSYAFGCIYEFLRITMVISGYTGTDCLLASTGFHLTGQLAVLKYRVKDVLNDTDGCRQGIRKMILRHHRLIRLADTLEDSFNIVICQQLLGTTIQICMTSYEVLSSLAVFEGIGILTFAIYVFILASTLFTYCYIGECLIDESTSLSEALYHCDWYELSTMDVKTICICMIRAKKPLRLTCAKFCDVSLRTFTDIMKTSMAYLSVLRTFM
ncbi:odorant receptor 13a-like isoform X2 [Vespula pensylvanica]|uniref:odorant receptor 13a-like isoform X2 n=1 Tax=Vespula pensylvanica TaxID=30213 RepID=UPI001CB9E7DA|nr:odorant receptor 13a-like isoform X2 [Vespula pensylvanica]